MCIELETLQSCSDYYGYTNFVCKQALFNFNSKKQFACLSRLEDFLTFFVESYQNML